MLWRALVIPALVACAACSDAAGGAQTPPAALVCAEGLEAFRGVCVEPARRYEPTEQIDQDNVVAYGDPLTDLGLLMAYWTVLDRLKIGFNPIADGLGADAGFPSGDELLARYAAGSGAALDDLHWYVAMACYKLAVILEGIHFRYTSGQTVGAGFDQIGALVPPLLAQGLAAINGES